LGSKVKVTASNDPENRVNSVSSSLFQLISPKLVDAYTWDILIRSNGQRSRSQQAMTRKPREYNIFVNIWASFTKVQSRMYLGLRHTDCIKKSKIQVTAAGRHHISDTTGDNLPYSAWLQMYLHS